MENREEGYREDIRHVIRMGNERLTKAMVFGWYEGLEGKEKRKGKKRKTVLYWKRISRECGVDWTDIERICGDRDSGVAEISPRGGRNSKNPSTILYN